LDDIRDPKVCITYMTPKVGSDINIYLRDWVICRNYDEFVNTIKLKGLPKLVSFDHDLSAEHYRPSMYDQDKHYNRYYYDGTFKEKTGYDCAKWLVDYCIEKKLELPRYFVHSMNPIGSDNIIHYLENFKEKYKNVK
jgi:hypothetical protein